jgi:two-component system, OmpR family, response regulator
MTLTPKAVPLMPPPLSASPGEGTAAPRISTGARILIVEDDAGIRRLVADFLADKGFLVSVAGSAREMDRILDSQRVDLLLLDLLLPQEDGLSICRRIRARSSLPVIMLTARSSEMDRVIGLEMGADDYLVKPFGTDELLARIRALFRRAHSPWIDARPARAGIVRFAGWTLELGPRRLRDREGVRVPLTASEFRLLVVFCECANRTLSREQLLDLTRESSAAGADRAVDIQISRLRRKIEADTREPALIQTVRSGGYIFTAEVSFT